MAQPPATPGQRTSMRRYFEGHEDVYVRRLAAGDEGWDDGPYDAFALRAQVEAWLAASPAARRGGRVLELGCGTGALCCMLAARGFAVTGLDISSTAIAHARSVAAARALAVDFAVSDVCAWRACDVGLDIVIDAHLLHCIVYPAERRSLLAQVASALGADGEFWTETMIDGAAIPLTPTRRIDAAGVVWTGLPREDAARWAEAVVESDLCWLPTRYVAPTGEALVAEFAAAGLHALEARVDPPAGPGHATTFVGRFARRAP